MGPLSAVRDGFPHDAFDLQRAYTTSPQRNDDAVPAATLPGLVESHPAHTPLTDEPECANMNTLVGGALAPVSSPPPPRRPSKAGPDFRL